MKVSTSLLRRVTALTSYPGFERIFEGDSVRYAKRRDWDGSTAGALDKDMSEDLLGEPSHLYLR